ncbi:tail fiber assembly protein [Salmonella enterica subsp. enterica]|nr:tail fiber assembly protein [Salmonella enterica subsp. enterica]EDQ2988648.1 tail fiber assembly protein [Salmonella enterica subsp. enterica]
MENMNSKYSLSPEKAVIGDDGLSVNPGWITVYHAGPDGEYTGASNDYLMQGVGLSAGAYADAPEIPADPEKAVRRLEDGSGWEIVTDHRGKTAWNTADHTPQQITFLGDLPDTLTFIQPESDFDKWDGNTWVTDETARKAAAVDEAQNKKSRLLSQIRDITSIWQTQLQMGDISDENKVSLSLWLNYYNQVNAVNIDDAPDIVWPDAPDETP